MPIEMKKSQSIINRQQVALTCPLCGSSRLRFKHRLFDDHTLTWTDRALIFRCKNCGHVFSTLKEVKEESYRSSYYVFQPERYQADAAFAENCVSWLAKKTAIVGKRILDVGCGAGFFCEATKNAGAIVTGLEPFFDKDHGPHARTDIRIVHRFFEDLNADFDKFDIVTMWDVFEHFHRPVDALRKAYSVLHDNGYLCLSVPNQASIFAYIAGPFWRGYNPYHVSHFKPDLLINLLRQHHFEVLSVETYDNNLLSAEGFFRTALKDRVKVLVATVPFAKRILFSRRSKHKQSGQVFTGHNDYLENDKSGKIAKALEALIAELKIGDQIRVFAKKIKKNG